MDVRDSESLGDRSVEDIRATSDWFAKQAEGSDRTCAFVAQPGVQYGLMRIVSAWLEHQGFRTLVTTNLEQAIRWLQR